MTIRDLDFRSRIALGDIPGARKVMIFGYNLDVDAAAAEDIINFTPPYGFLASGSQLEIVSSDADDDGDPVDTGARTVLLDMLDSNYRRVVETLTLNGTNAVATTATNIIRLNEARVITAGSSLYPEGTLTIRVAAAGATVGQIDAGSGGFNRTGHAAFTVPKGCYLIMETLCANGIIVGGASGDFEGRLTIFKRSSTAAAAWTMVHSFHFTKGGPGFIFPTHEVFGEKNDIIVLASTDTNNTSVNFEAECYLIGTAV